MPFRWLHHGRGEHRRAPESDWIRELLCVDPTQAVAHTTVRPAGSFVRSVWRAACHPENKGSSIRSLGTPIDAWVCTIFHSPFS